MRMFLLDRPESKWSLQISPIFRSWLTLRKLRPRLGKLSRWRGAWWLTRKQYPDLSIYILGMDPYRHHGFFSHCYFHHLGNIESSNNFSKLHEAWSASTTAGRCWQLSERLFIQVQMSLLYGVSRLWLSNAFATIPDSSSPVDVLYYSIATALLNINLLFLPSFLWLKK